ncbi:MAG: VWA domain-containing protein [Planctomycetaceae bacterium]
MIDWYSPGWLLSLWVVPVLGFFLFSAVRWRSRNAESFASAGMLKRLAPNSSVFSRYAKALLVLVATTCLLIAIARPRWGTYMQDVSTSGSDIFVVLDVSRSMLAEDVRPNRLDRAKSDILDLVAKAEGDRVGLIAFAGTPLLQVPLTTDLDFFRSTLTELSTDVVPRGGSMLGDAILKALKAMESRFDRQQVIVLVTDGEDQDSFPEEAAKAAAERGVKIVSVGLGDPIDGARIPVRDGSGNLSYVQYNGAEVWSILKEDTLKELAETTGGAYIPARTSVYDLGEIYENHLSAITEDPNDTQQRERLHERFQWFAAFAFFCLLVEGFLSSFRSSKQVV